MHSPSISNGSEPSDLALRPVTGGLSIISTVSLSAPFHVDEPKVSDNRYRTVLCVSSDHPCLPGHFPGQPLVPGVVLLEYVAKALRAWRGQRLARVVEAKFMAALYPGEQAELVLDDKAGRVRFEILRDGLVLSRGLVEGVA
jgi:3-hydroxyacyl-[acyl-carrier-protein] dehydratase